MILYWTASAGAAVWIGVRLFAERVGPLDRVVISGVLVVVPLALAVIPPGSSPRWPPISWAAALLSLPAGLACTASFLLGAGPLAGALAAPWVGLTLLVGTLGVTRLRLTSGPGPRVSVQHPDWTSGPGPNVHLAEVCFAAGLLYLPVSAFWLVASRLGVAPFGFDPLIVLLTAAHFCFAGLAAPVVAGMALRRLHIASMPMRVAVWLVTASVTLGQPVVAAGIAASPALGFAGAVVLSAGLLVLGALTLARVLRETTSKLAKTLLVVSSLSLLLSMPLAVAWAWGELTRARPLDMLWMIRIHGMANAHGFALCGLLAWAIEGGVRARSASPPRPRSDPPTP